jgi:hypothetical protein
VEILLKVIAYAPRGLNNVLDIVLKAVSREVAECASCCGKAQLQMLHGYFWARFQSF